MIKREINWITEKIKEYWKNPFFYIYQLIFMYIAWKMWYVYLFIMCLISLSCVRLLFLKNPKIIFTDRKINIAINYYRINMLYAFSKKIDKNAAKYIIFMYIFRLIIGLNYKLVRMSISSFDCLYREYVWADISKKKKNVKIMKKYMYKSLENFVFIEFIKTTPILEKKIKISFLLIEKEITIII